MLKLFECTPKDLGMIKKIVKKIVIFYDFPRLLGVLTTKNDNFLFKKLCAFYPKCHEKTAVLKKIVFFACIAHCYLQFFFFPC